MKKFIIRIILVLMPVLLIVVGVNYFGDAANLFSAGYEEQIANGLKKGYNVTNVSNYDERILQKHIIESKTCPEIVVLGSSRTLLINSEYFKGKTFFNNSVSGASLQDILAIFELYQNTKCKPKHIILGLDPWTLNANNGQTRWKSLTTEYNSIYNKLENDKSVSNEISKPDSKYLQLLSPSYFQASIKNIGHKKDIGLTKTKTNTTFTRLADGSISYDIDFRNSSPEKVESMVGDYISGEIYGIEKFDTISKEMSELLDKFLAMLKNENIKVTIVLTPYHPKVYNFIANNPKYKQVINSEKIYNSLANKYNFEILGTFNPDVLTMDNTYFFDGMHSKEKGIKKIADQINHTN